MVIGPCPVIALSNSQRLRVRICHSSSTEAKEMWWPCASPLKAASARRVTVVARGDGEGHGGHSRPPSDRHRTPSSSAKRRPRIATVRPLDGGHQNILGSLLSGGDHPRVIALSVYND